LLINLIWPWAVTSICICFWIRHRGKWQISGSESLVDTTRCHPWKWNFPECLTHWNDLPAVNNVLKNVCMNLCVKISCKIIRAKKLKFFCITWQISRTKSYSYMWVLCIRTCEHSVFWMSCWIYCCSWNWQYFYWYKNFFLTYCISKKSWPILYRKLRCKWVQTYWIYSTLLDLEPVPRSHRLNPSGPRNFSIYNYKLDFYIFNFLQYQSALKFTVYVASFCSPWNLIQIPK